MRVTGRFAGPVEGRLSVSHSDSVWRPFEAVPIGVYRRSSAVELNRNG